MIGIGLSLALMAPPAAVGGVVLIYTPSIELHRELVQRIEQRDPSIVALTLEDPWPKSSKPRAAIALGTRALVRVNEEWPDLPRGALLQWAEPPSSRASSELWGSLRPEPLCTAEILRRHHGPHDWLVIAAEGDGEAEVLARALGAALVLGPPALQHRQVTKHPYRNVWLRAQPRDASAVEWLTWLGHLGKAAHIFVGSDMPGLTRLGFEHPVQADLDAMAKDTVTWLQRARRRPIRGRTRLEVRCLPK